MDFALNLIRSLWGGHAGLLLGAAIITVAAIAIHAGRAR